MNEIIVHQLHKAYPTPNGELKVLRGIDLCFEAGDFVAIVGPSGTGKTTFLNMLTGIDAPTQGEVTINGMNMTRANPAKLVKWRARQIGIVFQFFQLLPTLTIAENIMFPMDYAGVHHPSARSKVALSLLEQLGIGNQAYKMPDMLSGGQQQRVAIARALANTPPIIIADEPTANLDTMSAKRVYNMFQALADEGAIVIMTTYDTEISGSVGRCLALDAGILH